MDYGGGDNELWLNKSLPSQNWDWNVLRGKRMCEPHIPFSNFKVEMYIGTLKYRNMKNPSGSECVCIYAHTIHTLTFL